MVNISSCFGCKYTNLIVYWYELIRILNFYNILIYKNVVFV